MSERSHPETYEDMEEFIGTGKVRAIRVANCRLQYSNKLLPSASIVLRDENSKLPT